MPEEKFRSPSAAASTPQNSTPTDQIQKTAAKTTSAAATAPAINAVITNINTLVRASGCSLIDHRFQYRRMRIGKIRNDDRIMLSRVESGEQI